MERENMKKNYKLLVFIVLLLAFSFSVEAQFRAYRLPEPTSNRSNPNGRRTTRSPNTRTTTTRVRTNRSSNATRNYGEFTRGRTRSRNTEEDPFIYEINFTNTNELFRLEAARLNAARREYNKWLSKQRTTLLKEINKQLRTNYTDFKTAKNAYFHNYEKNIRRIESKASTESWKFSEKAKKLNTEKSTFINEMYLIKKALYPWCQIYGYGSEQCNRFSSTTIRGLNLGRASRTALNQLYDGSVKEFSSREFESAQNQAWAKGIESMVYDGSLLNTMVNRRIKHFDKLDSQVQVYQMINYLSRYYNSNSAVFGMNLPDAKYRIPLIWHEKTIVEMGKKRASMPTIKALVFSTNYIQDLYNECQKERSRIPGFIYLEPDYCTPRKIELEKLREEIVQEYIDDHKKNIKKWYLDKDDDGYHSQQKEVNGKPGDKWKTQTKGKDCDDNDPGATVSTKTWYLDNDEDGYYKLKKQSCKKPTEPSGKWTSTILEQEDCDDSDPNKTVNCNEKEDCDTSLADLKKIFPTTSDTRLQEIANAINKFGKDFGVDTKEKLQHFLAQAGHESNNFNAFEENLNYRWERLGTSYWKRYFNPITNPIANPDKENPSDYKRSAASSFVDVQKLANLVYADANRSKEGALGNVNAGDGYKFRGRGIFQLTGRANYTRFNTFYRANYNSSVNLLTNPDLVSSDKDIAVISALWFYKNNVLDKVSVNNSTSVLAVTEQVNGGTNGIGHRAELFTKTQSNIDCIK